MKEKNSKILNLEECLRLAGSTKCMVVKEGAIAEIPGILKSYFAGGNPAAALSVFLIADKNTFRVAGENVLKIINESGIAVDGSYVFDEGIHAEYDHIKKIRAVLEEASEKTGKEGNDLSAPVPVAVGSGTINDLVKRAASELHRPYLCVPTAASVDGYTAYGAAILYEKYKQTMPCEAPLAVVADSAILASAPAYLSSSGYGDLAGKLIAGSDWIIADKLFALDGKGELAPATSAIDSTGWTMVQNPLRDYLSRSANAAKGDREAVGALFEALGITGFALQYMKDSRVVSGCEHMWAHVWEMENLSVDGVPVTHGHKVAMGTLAACAFTECLFSEKPALAKNAPSWNEREADIRGAFSGIAEALPLVLKTSEAKFIKDAGHLKKLREGILDIWDAIRVAVFEQLPPYTELCALLNNSACPVKAETINLSRKQVIECSKKAHMIRKRFTVLDLAYEMGIFDTVLKKMETGEYFY